MPVNRVNMKIGRLVAVCLAVTGLLASEHHGVVNSGGLPIPGATVTATQGDKKLVTTTDDQGAYSFPDLADGVWNVQVEMLGFAKKSKEIGVAPNAPSPSWDLKLSRAADSERLSGPRRAGPEAGSAGHAAPKPATPHRTNATANRRPPAAEWRRPGRRPSVHPRRTAAGAGRRTRRARQRLPARRSERLRRPERRNAGNGNELPSWHRPTWPRAPTTPS